MLNVVDVRTFSKLGFLNSLTKSICQTKYFYSVFRTNNFKLTIFLFFVLTFFEPIIVPRHKHLDAKNNNVGPEKDICEKKTKLQFFSFQKFSGMLALNLAYLTNLSRQLNLPLTCVTLLDRLMS
jgi:hypothetical protein